MRVECAGYDSGLCAIDIVTEEAVSLSVRSVESRQVVCRTEPFSRSGLNKA